MEAELAPNLAVSCQDYSRPGIKSAVSLLSAASFPAKISQSRSFSAMVRDTKCRRVSGFDVVFKWSFLEHSEHNRLNMY